MVKSYSRSYFAILFHLILWITWISLPIINAGDNERHRLYMTWLIPITLTHIPLFLINSEWLIPSIFRRKGIPTYLLSLILLVTLFSSLQYFLKDWIIPDELFRRHQSPSIFWTVMPALFATALSTGYGLIIYLLNQEKAKQEEQKERLQSELSFLRSQISPHFIFNVLNSIVYLIRSKSEMAETVTIKLSELMRYMLYSSNEEQVHLEEELKYLRNYIDLQKIRFEEDVDIQFSIFGQVNNQHLEPMLLIPFVENAFKHGVGMIKEPIIDIQVIIREKSFQFLVKNKISPEKPENKAQSSGIGLRNVKRRLELLYPDSHRLLIDNSGEWFSVEMSLFFTEEKIKGALIQEKSIEYEA